MRAMRKRSAPDRSLLASKQSAGSRFTIKNAASARGDVDASKGARVANDHIDPAELLPVIIDSYPVCPDIVRPINAGHVVDLAPQINRRVGLSRRRFAEANL